MPVADITYKGTADYLSRKLRTVEKHVVSARRQRDALAKTLERIIEDMDGSGDEIGAKQLRAHLRGILSENA